MTHLRDAGFTRKDPDGRPFSRVIVEKPIGHDLASAKEINDCVAEVFHEREVFRIDHYLGKETVQSILVLRFSNSIFEPLWNQKYIDHVQITVSEEEGVGTRAGYYEEGKGVEALTEEMVWFREQGMAGVKMKVGRYSVEEDVERFEYCRKGVDASFKIAADSNRAWTVRDAITFARGVRERNLDLLWLEEPVQWNNEIVGMRRVREVTGVAVTAGQSERSAAQVRDLWRHWEEPRIEWCQGGHVTFGLHAPVRALIDDALRATFA